MTDAADAPGASERIRSAPALVRDAAIAFLNANKTLVGLLLLVAGASVASPYFLTLGNLTNVLRQVSINGLLALGMTLVILSQGIDLSVGSVLGLVTIVGARAAPLSSPFIVALCLAIGLLCGLINGVLVSYVGLVSFLATLATALMIRGITLILSDGRTIITDFPPGMNFIGVGYAGLVPMPVIVLLAAYTVFLFVMRLTRFGRMVYAIGGNEEAARLCGVPVKLHRLAAFTLSGLLAAAGGIVYVARLSTGDPSAGLGYELTIIACVAVGGTSFSGGYGGVGLTFIGTLIIGVIDNILNLMSISPFAQMIVRGVIIILAVRASTTALLRARGRRGEIASGAFSR